MTGGGGRRWSDRFPLLRELFGGYFYQCSEEDYPTTEAAVEQYAADSDTPALQSVLIEVERLLGLNLDEDELGTALNQLSSDYVPSLGGESNAEWLREIAGVIEAKLVARRQQETRREH